MKKIKPGSKDHLRVQIELLQGKLLSTWHSNQDMSQEITALKMRAERHVNDTQHYKHLWATQVSELYALKEKYDTLMRINDYNQQNVQELLTERSDLHEHIRKLAQKVNK